MLPNEVDWTALLPEARDTLREIALRISLGFTHAEIAAALGIRPNVVSERLRDLRHEITAQNESPS